MAVKRDQPELGDARGIGAEGCGDDSAGATFQVDGRHEMPLAAAFDRCDERLLLRERAEINQCCDAGRRRALAARLNSRQNARLCQRPVLWVCTGRALTMRSQTCGGGTNSGISAAQGGKPLLPFGDPARKAALTRHALFSRGTVGAFKHAQRILGREQFVFRQAVMVERITHCSRHAFSLNIARRTSSSWSRARTFIRAARSS